jgi:hypothetical protein
MPDVEMDDGACGVDEKIWFIGLSLLFSENDIDRREHEYP